MDTAIQLLRRLPRPVAVCVAPVNREGFAAALHQRFGKAVASECFVFLDDSSAANEVWSSIEVLIADPPYVAKQLGKARQLRWMQSTFAGVDALFKQQGADEPEFVCTRLSGKFGQQMTEYAMCWLLYAHRKVASSISNQSQHHWDEVTTRSDRKLSSMTLGVLGLGDIGSHIARGAKALGMRTLGFKRRIGESKLHEGADVVTDNLTHILRESDCIVNVLPSTAATRGILSGDALSVCDRKPVFINIGRGDVIDEDSVLQALDRGWISFAVLDVFETEPLPTASPLWSRDDVIVTPHVAAHSLPDDVLDVFLQNLATYASCSPDDGRRTLQQEMNHVVDWSNGY